MKLGKFILMAGAATALVSASAASATTVLISTLLTWKSGTALQSLSAPGDTLSFTFQATTPTTPLLNTFHADLNGSTVAVAPTSIMFTSTGYTLTFAGPYTLNVKTNLNWTGAFPGTPFTVGNAKANVSGGVNSNAQVSVLSVGSTVPEPASWVLMLGGFGLAGAALRTRVPKQKIAYTA
jgi:hypothetical protein